jgi:hypothetical protein
MPTAVRLPRYTFCFLFLFITCHCSLGAALAQGTTATLSGTVTDQNGAVIPDVSIAVINIAQGFQRSATTNGEGAFILPLLPPGKYTVKAEHAGFTPTEVRDVVLNVNDQVAMKIHMNVGTVSQTVQVVEGSSLINESPAVATVVDSQFAANLPLNGRSFQSLITLSPGVVLTKTVFSEPGQFSVNGQRADANYFTVDGVSANIGAPFALSPGQNGAGALPGLTTFGGTNNLVSVDALQEFKILTSTYAPEFGRTPGAQVSMVTRSGTNHFHGALFEYLRNDALDANDWFANSRGLRRPALRQNDFGGVIGGPVLLPRFGDSGYQPGYNGRNRTFFFFSYEGLRLRQPLVGLTDVPSRSARSSPLASPAIKQFLNAFPIPTGPDQLNGLAEYAASYSNPTNLNASSIRIDHTFNNKLNMFARFNYAPSETLTRTGDGLRSLNTIRLLSVGTRTFTVGTVFTINSYITNDLRFNHSRNSNGGFSFLDTFGGAVVPPNTLLFPPFASSRRAISVVSLSDGRNTSTFVGDGSTNVQRQINLVDNLSIVKETHLIKVGLDYRRMSPILAPRLYGQNVFFNGVMDPVDGALSGTAQQVILENNTGPQIPILTNLSLFGQDVWKATRTLNITYGIRWEVNTPPHEKRGNDAFAITGIATPNSIAFAPRGTPLWSTTYNNFAPRIGVAYQLSTRPGKEIVLRGGFGVFYDLGTGLITNAFTAKWPFTAVVFLSEIPYPVSIANATPPPVISTPPATTTLTAFDPHLKLPYTLQWNCALEQSLGSNQTISASYVAASGHRLLRQAILRFGSSMTFVNPNFINPLSLTTNSATSNYQALQLQFQRRLSSGLQALTSYTWAHSIDIASNDSGVTPPQGVINVNNDRGPSDFDVRHTLTGAVTYNIPTPQFGAITRTLFGGWAIDGTFTARSATPIDVLITNTSARFGSYTFRPNLIQGVPLYLSDPSLGGGRRINPAAFSAPLPGQQGTLGRNSLRGFPASQMDIALRRQFNLTERARLQFSTEVFNVFNHPSFGDPTPANSSLGSISASGVFRPNLAFGRSTTMLGRALGSGGNSGGFNPLYQFGGPRSIQLAIRVSF